MAVQARRAAPRGVDAALHLAGDGSVLARLLRAGGRIASTLGGLCRSNSSSTAWAGTVSSTTTAISRRATG